MDALFSYRPDEKPFIGYLFQRVAGAHQILNSLSDISTVAEPLTVACQRRWYGSLAVQEAAMLCRKQLHRILLLAVLGLSLGACVPYSDGGGSYYRSEVYTSPAPYYSGGGSYYSDGRYYSAPRRYYSPPARYYQPTPRYYHQPRVYQSAPRYYQPAPRADYRVYQNRGWDRHDRRSWDGHNRGSWDGRNRGGRGDDYRGHRDRRDGRGDNRGRNHDGGDGHR